MLILNSLKYNIKNFHIENISDFISSPFLGIKVSFLNLSAETLCKPVESTVFDTRVINFYFYSDIKF